jgi:chromate transporter
MAETTVNGRTSLVELAVLFARLGTIAFGGPAAHVAMMDDEVVRRRGWLTRAQFLDYVGATNLIPGPNSTELAIHIGHARAGWPGLLVAGLCFIVPATLIVGALAALYVRYGSLPDVAGVLYGVKPVVIAIVAHALWALGRTAIKTPLLAAVTVAGVVAVARGVPELLVLAAAAMVMILLHSAHRRWFTAMLGAVPLPASVSASALATTVANFNLTTLFLTFAKIGAVLFGSGYVLLAFLRSEFVERLGWLTEQQLLDAIAVGQVTPGPLFTTATFVGYLLGGPVGALVATIGIFLPAFVFVALSGPLVPRIRRSPAAGAALDGIARADGRRLVAARSVGARRSLERRPGRDQRGPAPAIPDQFGMARCRGRRDRMDRDDDLVPDRGGSHRSTMVQRRSWAGRKWTALGSSTR